MVPKISQLLGGWRKPLQITLIGKRPEEPMTGECFISAGLGRVALLPEP